MSQEISIRIYSEGVEEVTLGFRQIGDASADMGRKVADSSKQMDVAGEATRRVDLTQKQLMFTTAGLIGNSVQLGDIMDRMAKGQMDVGRGAIMLAMNFLPLGAQLSLLNARFSDKIAIQAASIAGDVKEAASAAAGAVAEGVKTIATWARVVAEKAKAVALAIANALEGPWGWAILAGAAAAAGIGIALATRIPEMAEGGIAYKPTYALIGEREPEAVVPLSRVLNTTSNRVENRPVNVYIYNPSFRNRGDLEHDVRALRRGVE